MRQLIGRWLVPLILVALLAACGSSSDSDPPSGGSQTATAQGVAVDPYISGAVFQEVTPLGEVLQTSSPSDDQGRFSFPGPVETGSTIEMKNDQRGTHLGAPFQGLLKRQVGADPGGILVASPLTTLLANGATAEEVVDFLAASGLSGITAADLLADPMAGLSGMPATGGTAENLLNLQAAMATNTLLHLLNDYAAGSLALASPTNRQLMADLVQATREVLDPVRLAQMAEILAADPEFAGHPLRLADALHFAGETMRRVGELAAAGSLPTQSAIENCVSDAWAAAPETLRSHLRNRLGMPDPGTPAPAPEPPATPDGQALFAERCTSCHNLGATNNYANLAGDGAKVQVKFASGSHMGQTLAADEVQAIADYVDAAAPNPDPAPTPEPTPTPEPPPVSADGQALFAERCTSCHNLGATSNYANLAGDGAKVQVKFASGSHMGQTLAAAEVQAIADYVDAAAPTPEPTPTPEPPPVTIDGQTLYDSQCAVCHSLGGYDASGAPDLAGRAGMIGAKTAGGHGGGPLAADALAALVAFVEAQSPATDPGTPAPPSYADCTACHGQPPAGSATPDTAGAHAAHNALPGLSGQCAVCHQDASHNGWVDLKFPAAYSAKTGPAVDNGDGTCSNISCHGGKRTPDWWSGSISATQCSSCHASGTGQYNGYFSGEHRRHASRYSCTVCHDSGKLAAGHFGGLDTPGMDTPAATIGGGSTRVTSYSGGSCTSTCHSREDW